MPTVVYLLQSRKAQRLFWALVLVLDKVAASQSQKEIDYIHLHLWSVICKLEICMLVIYVISPLMRLRRQFSLAVQQNRDSK